MCIVCWYNTTALCTRPVLVHYGIVVIPCRDQSEPVIAEPYVTELGTAERDYKALAEAEKATTGGISCDVDTAVGGSNGGKPETYVSLSAHALDRNVPAMFDLLGEVRRCRLTIMLTLC